MGDRICVRVTDGHRTSPTVYCHWAGLGAIMAMHRAIESSRREVSNILCNFIVTIMGRCRDSSYYIYNDGDAEGMADWGQLTSYESPYNRVAALSLNMSFLVVLESALDLPVPDTGLFVESSPFRIQDDIDRELVEDVFNMCLSDGQYEKLISEPGRYNNCIGIPWDRRHAIALVDFAWLRCEKDPGVELRGHLKSSLLQDKALDIVAHYINTEMGPFNNMVVPRIVLDRPQSCHLTILLMMNASRMIAFGSFEWIWEPLMYCIENIQGGENLSFISECDFSIRIPYDIEKLNPLGTQTE